MHSIDSNIHIFRKLDFRVISFAFLLEFCSYINRVCMGHAKNLGLNQDINMSAAEDSWSFSLIYLSYFLFSIPSALLLLHFGATIYITIILIVWGSISIGLGFVKNAPLLLVLRFLLGMAIAGFFPGMVGYLSRIYPKKLRSMRIVILYSAAILSAALAGFLAFGIEKMDGIGNLESWQWLFILIGIPVVLLGIATFLFLDKIPSAVLFLDTANKEIHRNIILNDDKSDTDRSMEATGLRWHHILEVLKSGRLWLFAMISIGNLGVVKYWLAYFPIQIKNMGYVGAKGALMSGVPYAFGFVLALLGGCSVTRFNQHGYHVAFCEIFSSIGFALMAGFEGHNVAVVYVGSCIATAAVFTCFALLMAWLSISVSGEIRITLSIAFVVGLGQIGGVVLPFVNHNNTVPDFRKMEIISSAVMIVIMFLTVLLRYISNRRTTLPAVDHRETVEIEITANIELSARY